MLKELDYKFDWKQAVASDYIWLKHKRLVECFLGTIRNLNHVLFAILDNPLLCTIYDHR